MLMRSINVSYLIALLLLCFPACSNQNTNTRYSSESTVPSYKKIDDLKAVFPQADKWTLIEYNDTKYLFFTLQNPSYGISSINFRGWYYDKIYQEWKQFVAVDSFGLGDVEIVFDENKGYCYLRGIANNNFMDVDAVSVSLNLVIR